MLSTNQHDIVQSNDLSIARDNCKQIVIDEVDVRRITYFIRRDALHVIWIDVKLGGEQYVQIPLGITGAENEDPVVLTVEKREGCDIVIQENLYEFGVY